MKDDSNVRKFIKDGWRRTELDFIPNVNMDIEKLLKCVTDTTYMVIAIAGNMGSGKTYMANKLKRYFNDGGVTSEIFSFAKMIKKVGSAAGILKEPPAITLNKEEIDAAITRFRNYINLNLFDYSRIGEKKRKRIEEMIGFYHSTKDINYKKVLARSFYQYFGTDIVRKEISSDFWIKQLLTEVAAANVDFAIVDDLRFVNEARTLQMLHDIRNGSSLLIAIKGANYKKINTGLSSHASESEVEFVQYRYCVPRHFVNNYDAESELEFILMVLSYMK